MTSAPLGREATVIFWRAPTSETNQVNFERPCSARAWRRDYDGRLALIGGHSCEVVARAGAGATARCRAVRRARLR
eukprot:2488645-Pyramimonas_sp.AAC.1